MSDLVWGNLNTSEKTALKMDCERSFQSFTQIFFQLLQGQKFLLNWHHKYECDLAEEIFYGKLKRVIINVSPGSTKTEIWSIHWIAWCIMKCASDKVNPRSTRWLPLSYSDDLVVENATRVKEIIDSEPFQFFWNLKLSKTIKSKSNWLYLDKNRNKHRLYGTSIRGQVTGRRAGYMLDNCFTGALILDDPLPPRDDSAKLIEKSNKQLNRVVRSRLAHDDVPIVMIQQRICKGDSTDFLMSDRTPDKYDLFRVPALIDRDYVDSLDEDTRENCVKDTGFDGKVCSYWRGKEPTATLVAIQKADNYMFSAQYQQSPDDALLEGVVYKKEIDLLISEGRLCHIPIESSLSVFSFWDLGIGDYMAFWLMQPFGNELRLIACYGNHDEPMSHYINWLLDFKDKYNVRYEKHYAPHDITVRNIMTGRSRKQEAEQMGIRFTVVPKISRKQESINALKKIFPRLFIDKIRCDTDASGKSGEFAKHTGLKALKNLRREWDHDNEKFMDEIGPKWCTDFTDALQQMGLAYKDKDKVEVKSIRFTAGKGNGWMSN